MLFNEYARSKRIDEYARSKRMLVQHRPMLEINVP